MVFGKKSTPEETQRYINFLCRVCGKKRYRAGGPECNDCYNERVKGKPGAEGAPC